MRPAFILIIFLVIASLAVPVHGFDWSNGVVIVLFGSQYGTGWWVAKNYVVTAAHVVNYQNGTLVQLIRGDWKASGQVVCVDSKLDVAVIKTDRMPVFAHVFPVASRVEKLQQLFVIGYPFELVQISKSLEAASSDPRIAEGFAAWYKPEYHLIEFQAETDAGNSGGPVVYANGAVAGLVSFALIGKAGVLYFASDADAIKQVLDKAGVHYTTEEPPVVAAGSGKLYAMITSRDLWMWSMAVSALVSIIVTVAWLATRGG